MFFFSFYDFSYIGGVIDYNKTKIYCTVCSLPVDVRTYDYIYNSLQTTTDVIYLTSNVKIIDNDSKDHCYNNDIRLLKFFLKNLR